MGSIPVRYSTMATKLTQHLLLKLGFRGEGKDITNNPAFRLKVPKHGTNGYYGYEIQVVLMPNLPSTNPNSGIVSLYDRGTEDAHCHAWDSKNDKGEIEKADIDFVQRVGDDGLRYGIKYITFPDRIIPIAWYVTTLERLNKIYVALTGNSPLKPRKKL